MKYLISLIVVLHSVAYVPLSNAADTEYADVLLKAYYSGANKNFEDFYGVENVSLSDHLTKLSPSIVLGNNNGCLSMPTGTFVIVGFTDNTIIDAPNQEDLFIQEHGGAGELADVYVSANNKDFVKLGTAGDDGISKFDLASINFTEPVVAVKIVGLDNKGEWPGFDLISVSAIEGAVGPASEDTDKDGLPDYWERTYNLDPENEMDAVSDLDSDGLPNFYEYHLLTNPTDSDCDKDGISDLFEIINQTDPLDASSFPGEDSDSDGMPNEWEIQYGFNPNDSSDSILDPDEDGFINIVELLIGGDPLRQTQLKTSSSQEKYMTRSASIEDNSIKDIINLNLIPSGFVSKILSKKNFHINRNSRNKIPKERIALNKNCEWSDNDGEIWIKRSCRVSAYHQPADATKGLCPNDKFTKLDGTGGSYEVVQDEYGNLVTDSKLMGTYNYADCDGLKGCFYHFYLDVIPHEYNPNYVTTAPVGYTETYDEKASDFGCSCEDTGGENICECNDPKQGCISSKPTKKSNVIGDPHFSTFDGLGYDLQAVGEFYYLEHLTVPNDMTVQVRLEPLEGSKHVSVVTAVSALISGDVVELYLKRTPRLYVNKLPVEENTEDIELPNGGFIIIKSGHYSFYWNDLSLVTCAVRGKKIDLYSAISEDNSQNIQGLAGNMDGDRSNDFADRDGAVLINQDEGPITKELLYGSFAECWRIRQEDSLFSYFDKDESTETYTDRNFPVSMVSAKDLSKVQYETAKGICESVGIKDPKLLEACILDVGLTGDDEFALGFTDAVSPTSTIVLETAPPAVILLDPENNSTNVSIGSSVRVLFSKPMDAASINSETFYLDKGVKGSVTYDELTMTATFVPSASLNDNTTFTATVTDAIKDGAGNSLSETYNWKFTTPADISSSEQDLPIEKEGGDKSDGSGCFIDVVCFGR